MNKRKRKKQIKKLHLIKQNQIIDIGLNGLRSWKDVEDALTRLDYETADKLGDNIKKEKILSEHVLKAMYE